MPGGCMIYNQIASMVKFYRKKSGLSQEKLATIAGLGKTVIYDIEKAKPTIQLQSLCQVLEVLNIKMRFDCPFPQDKE
jgi:HTH-type transcriptional regulator/antitoxin HipB